MLELFPEDKTEFSPSIPDGEVNYYSSFLSTNEADILFAKLLATTPWQSDSITVYGKTYNQPRLTSLHAIDETLYSYSNITMQPNPMTPVLRDILKKIELLEKK